MTNKRKQIQDAKASTGKPAKKVKNKFAKEKHKKSKKKSTSVAIVDKHVLQSNSSNKSFPKSKLVSALFNGEDDLKSAFDGEFKLSRDHVEQLNIIVNTSQIELKQALFIIYENKGYEALGCDDFKAYVNKYLTLSYDAALKQALAAKVAYVINGLDAIGFFSDNSMLPMKDLSDVQIKNVVEQIEEEHDMDITIRGKYTRKMVEAAMRELGLLDKDDSDEGLEVVEDEEDAVDQTDDDLGFDDSDDEELDSDTRPVAKANISTSKQSSKAKQTYIEDYIEDVVKSECHRQFLEQFNIEADTNKSNKAIFTAFINTDAGKKSEVVTNAIDLLCTHLVTLFKSNLSDTLEAQDE